jgi:hypothetical protein
MLLNSMQLMDAWLIFEVTVFLAFHDSNHFDSHGREYVFSPIRAFPEKVFEMLSILEIVPCSRRFCLNCSPICPKVDAYLLGRFPASIAFDNPLLGPAAENGGLMIGRVQQGHG